MTKETWIIEGETGISSTAIWSHFSLGMVRERFHSNPSDPSDFLRCYWLLQLAPEWRERIKEMDAYRGWENLSHAWDELENMLLDVWPKSCTSGHYAHGEPAAMNMYKRMKELLNEG